MNKWIAEFELEDGDIMPEHMDLEYKGARIDFHCRPLEQEPKTGHCKDCKYYEYDSVAKVDVVPLIVAHEICSRWGDGCKTNENGYCFLFEPQESEDKE